MEFEHGVNRLQAKLEALLHQRQRLLQPSDDEGSKDDTATVIPW